MANADDAQVNETLSGQPPLTLEQSTYISPAIERDAKEKVDNPEALYRSLVRSLRRRSGFGILFLQCTPVKGQEIFSRLQQDLPQKQIGMLTLDEPVDNLRRLVAAREDLANLNVLFIEGIDKSLAPYVKSEAGRNDYYKLEVLPPILNHLNRQRENFSSQFSRLCLVFVVQPFSLKYFMHRAVDFFDWRSGIWTFASGEAQLEKETSTALDKRYSEYLDLSPKERDEIIADLQNLIDEKRQSDEQRSRLLVKQGWVLGTAQNFKAMLRCCETALTLQATNDDAWYAKGIALGNLGRYEEAITAYDTAIDLKPDHYAAINNKGNALGNLGRYEDAITTYAAIDLPPDRHEVIDAKDVAPGNLERYEEALAAYDTALGIRPSKHKHTVFYNKGTSLSKLGRYEESISTYDAALAIQSNYPEALYNKGTSLVNLGRYEEAITAYDVIKSVKYEALNNKGYALDELGQYEKAITAYDDALNINPNQHEALNNKGCALDELGCHEEAIAAYDAALALKPDKYEALYNKGISLVNLGRYKEAIAAYDAALAIQPDNASTWYNKACSYALSKQLEDALTCLQKAIELDSTGECSEMAKTDTDFDGIRDSPQFRALISEGQGCA